MKFNEKAEIIRVKQRVFKSLLVSTRQIIQIPLL